MNIQEKFTRFLKEEPSDSGQAHGFARVGAPGGIPSVDDVVMGDAFNIDNPEMLRKLNGYLVAAAASPVINPYFLLKRVQDKLSQIGLQFELPTLVGETGTVSKPLTQFGGVYGYEKPRGEAYKKGDTGSVNFPKIRKGDGITDRIPGGVDIRVHWTCHKGLYTLEVELVAGKAKPEKIQESEDLCPICGKPDNETHTYKTCIFNQNKVQKIPKKIKGDLKEEDIPNTCPGCNDFKKPHSVGCAYAPPATSPKAVHEPFVKDAGDNLKHSDLVKEEEDLPNPRPLDGPTATKKSLKRHRKIDNPFSIAWYLKKHGDKYSGR